MNNAPTGLAGLKIDRSVAPRRGGGTLPWIVLLVLALAGMGWWWSQRDKGIKVSTAEVRIQPAGGSTARTLLNASGYVTTRLEATVSSKITGKVAEIFVEEGMKVEKGQVLARLDASNVETKLLLAQAQLASAKLSLAETEPMVKYTAAEMQRLAGLIQTSAVSRSDLAKAEAEASSQLAKLERQRMDVVAAERQVDDIKQSLDDTIIRAPFAGVVTTKDSQPGEMISPMSSGGFTRTGICSLVDMASLEIEVDVSESFINRVKPAQAVEATLDAYPDWKIPGKVIAIIPTADRQKATVKVRVGFDKLDPRILPQMGVKVAFQGDGPAEATPAKGFAIVPKEAVQNNEGRDIVWVVAANKAERRAVKVARIDGPSALLASGVEQGEIVVTNPPASLNDGAPVTIDTTR